MKEDIFLKAIRNVRSLIGSNFNLISLKLIIIRSIRNFYIHYGGGAGIFVGIAPTILVALAFNFVKF